jgi:hypothetical protein
MLDDEIMYYNNDPNKLNLLVLCFLHSKTNNTQIKHRLLYAFWTDLENYRRISDLVKKCLYGLF